MKYIQDKVSSFYQTIHRAHFRSTYVIVELIAGWCDHCVVQRPEMDAVLDSFARNDPNTSSVSISYEGQERTGEYRSVVARLSQSGDFSEVQIWKKKYALEFLKAFHSQYGLYQALFDMILSKSYVI